MNIFIPLAELEQHLAEFDPAHEIVAYCLLAFEAVTRERLPGHMPAGLPVENNVHI